jgi:hypothetical protein
MPTGAIRNMQINNLDKSQCTLTMNLSSRELTNVEILLLDKGLSYIPTPKSLNVFKIYESQNRLIRNLKIRDYFSNKPGAGDRSKDSKVCTGPSNWIPPDHHVSQATLNTVQGLVTRTEFVLRKNIIRNNCILLNKGNNNLTSSERTALSGLRNDQDVIIKPADKGGATVVMNKLSYLREAYRQLNDTHYYCRLDRPIYKENITNINNILTAVYSKGLINRKQFNYLQARESDRPRTFYLLPKVHKSRAKWPQEDMPEGRPIVSDVGSESYRVSEFINSIIRPLSMTHEAYIKDSYDFVSKVRDRQIPSNALLCTCDVTALYTNMSFERTLRVTRECLEKSSPNKILNKYLMELLEITLQKNDFEFNGEYFLQICGTAMGKSYAPALADLYMLEFDHAACHGDFSALIDLYFRFLDDVFFIFLGDVTELKNLENYLNSLIPGIKITLNHSPDNINFLDTTVYKHAIENNNPVLHTRIYFKDTDTHQLLHKESYHPKHTFKGIIKSQLLRFKRLSSTFTDYDNTCKILFNSLEKRNYSKSLLRKMKRDIWASEDNLLPVGRGAAAAGREEELPIVIPFSDFGRSLSIEWKRIIKLNPKLANFRLITAFSNSPNLRQKLVRSSFSPTCNGNINYGRGLQASDASTFGMFQCDSNRCRACNYISERTYFQSFVNSRRFNINSRLNCASCNLIYLVNCDLCGFQYIGQTGRALADRINDHLSNIRTKKSTPIALHFNLPSHSITHFTIQAIEKIPDSNDALKLRLLKETTWQNILQTAFPLGINNLKPQYLQ